MPWSPTNLSDIERRAWALIEKRSAPGKHAARNAFYHMERAYALEHIDPEMAVFRAITAEEEAVRAIFHALQRLNYPHARQLNWQNHKHKAAVVHYFEAISAFLAKSGIPKPAIGFEEIAGVDCLRLRFPLRTPSGAAWLYPDPPLDFNLEIDGNRHDFRRDIEELLQAKSVAKFTTLVRDRANIRNQLLYANNEGIPQMGPSLRETLDDAKGRVEAHLAIFLLIDTIEKQQLFVTQALDAFVRLMSLIPDEPA